MTDTAAQVRTVAGTPIHLTEHGQGPRVVLVHGSAQGSQVGGEKHFANQASLATRGWTIITPDRPGHGLSPAPDRGDNAAEDAVWVTELLGDGGHLVGHSFGGAVALAAAARNPEVVRSLTLIEPALQKAGSDIPAVRKFLARMIVIMLFSFSRETRIKRFANLVGIPDSIRGGTSKEEYRKMGEGLARLTLPTKAEILAQLAVVKAKGIPLLVVTGGWNEAFDAVGARAAELGGGRFAVVQSPHHFPQNVSDEFNDLLDAAMRAAEPGEKHGQ
jgi:pimeloyl-ACP methyl ester carboxylesterase